MTFFVLRTVSLSFPPASSKTFCCHVRQRRCPGTACVSSAHRTQANSIPNRWPLSASSGFTRPSLAAHSSAIASVRSSPRTPSANEPDFFFCRPCWPRVKPFPVLVRSCYRHPANRPDPRGSYRSILLSPATGPPAQNCLRVCGFRVDIGSVFAIVISTHNRGDRNHASQPHRPASRLPHRTRTSP